MHSSTSSSDPAPILVAKVAWPTAAAAAVLVFAAEAWYRVSPADEPRGIESILLDEQMGRAATAPQSDLVVLGDSSALMDVVPRALGDAAGLQEVQCLASIGFAGPAGWARTLDRHLGAGRRPGNLLLLVHGASLSLDEDVYVRAGIEAEAAGHRAAAVAGGGARRKLFHEFVRPLLSLPLPGSFGHVYGSEQGLRRAIREGDGALTDPNPPWRPRSREPAFEFRLSPAVRARLPALARSFRESGARVFVGMTPIPESLAGDAAAHDRARAAAELLEGLGLPPDVLLDLPLARPDSWFSTPTHLAPHARVPYTGIVAASLAARLRSR